MSALKLCTVCGEPSVGSRCDEHPAPAPPKPSATRRGYNSAWTRLSIRARTIQPWCSVCGTKDDLTTDHLRWPARTLRDVDVLCRAHNSAKGEAPRDSTSGKDPLDPVRDPRGMADIPTHRRDLNG